MKNRHLFLLLILLLSEVCHGQTELARTAGGTSEQTLSHTGFTVSYNALWRIPNWVAWELTREETSGTARRMDQFVPDRDVQHGSATTYDYSRSGYDRGHMAPAGDMRWSFEAMQESFYLSNICPQDHELNAGLWEKLESRCRGWARFHGKVWICCGPVVTSRKRTIGGNRVSVPDGFFKVVCTERKGRSHAVGFLFPNSPCEGTIWDYAHPVDVIEEAVGHDFFHLLPDDVENAMESSWDEKFWKSN